MNQRKKLLSIISIVLVALIAGAAVFVSYRLSTQQGITPVAPESQPAAAGCREQCPGRDGVLRNCTPPEADGSPQESICNTAGRVESCGGTDFCCPKAGGKWTKDMTKCPTTSPTPGAGVECAKCTSDVNCSTGLKCDLDDGRCKKTDGTSVCFEGSNACTTSGTVVCVPTSVITCTPDCSTQCGLAASSISTCKNSCGVATTKNCPATAACADSVTVVKKAYQNDSGNSAGRYTYTTEIDTVSKNQTFVYAIQVTNNGNVAATMSIADILDGDHQDQLTFVDASSGCSYTSANRRIFCENVSVGPKQTGVFGFRMKVGAGAVNGDVIKNVVIASVGGTNVTAENELRISTVVGCNNTCTTDSECSVGLVCDTVTNKCRKEACLDSENCVCPQITTAATPRPTRIVTAAPTAPAAQPTEYAVIPTQQPGAPTPLPTVLPDAGILDFPGVAAFGGGLMLAIIGILLAL